jgi:hypothetical protein
MTADPRSQLYHSSFELGNDEQAREDGLVAAASQPLSFGRSSDFERFCLQRSARRDPVCSMPGFVKAKLKAKTAQLLGQPCGWRGILE